jgi:hypothetical protein
LASGVPFDFTVFLSASFQFFAFPLPTDSEALSKLRKGDERKALLATVMRSRTTVGVYWRLKK